MLSEAEVVEVIVRNAQVMATAKVGSLTFIAAQQTVIMYYRELQEIRDKLAMQAEQE